MKCLVVVVLVLSTGLHWAALQSIAWTTMIAANLGCESLSMAVSQTFDGRHPCPLCKAIAAAKKAEKKNDGLALKLKLEYPPLTGNPALIAPRIFKAFQVDDLFAEFLTAHPPLPPPRSFSV